MAKRLQIAIGSDFTKLYKNVDEQGANANIQTAMCLVSKLLSDQEKLVQDNQSPKDKEEEEKEEEFLAAEQVSEKIEDEVEDACGEEFEIEKILGVDKKVRGGRRETRYLVKFVGYPDSDAQYFSRKEIEDNEVGREKLRSFLSKDPIANDLVGSPGRKRDRDKTIQEDEDVYHELIEPSIRDALINDGKERPSFLSPMGWQGAHIISVTLSQGSLKALVAWPYDERSESIPVSYLRKEKHLLETLCDYYESKLFKFSA